jgi:hypothetical protein
MNPIESIVPILAIDEAKNVRFFLGTGTFVGKKPYLLTAVRHVSADDSWKKITAR